MLDFSYFNQTEIVFGKNTELSVGELVKKRGKKAMIVYGGGSIKRSGLYDRVKKSLDDAGVAHCELGGVKPNPVLSLVHKGIELGRREGADFILAVGGGSVIDSAKVISMGMLYDGEVWDFFEGKTAEKVVPVGVVLTIPAAGSENSADAVITNDLRGNEKWPSCSADYIRPVFSILNPELTFTLPPFQTACGAADIIAHALERYFTQDRDVDLSDRLLESVVRTMVKFAPAAIASPEDYNARSQIMWAGTLAHNSLFGCGRTGDWASHMIEHELSALYDVAHGAGLAVIVPAWMEYVLPGNEARLAQFANRVFDVEYDAFVQENTARKGISLLRAFFKSIDLPVTLSELGIPGDRVDEMAERCTYGDQWAPGNFKKLKKADVAAIYKSCL